MPNAVVSTTSNTLVSADQGISVSQGIGELQSSNSLYHAPGASPGCAFKMRAWDTVEEQYVYWMSYGDMNGKPPTLNPVTNVTATRVSLMRTV
jgi:hypothetical protein